MITVIVIDDEEESRHTLKKIISKYCPQMHVVGEAGNINEAYSRIMEKKPDVIFLDVEMPHGSGFELLKKFEIIPFEIIFTTAFDRYALKAIKFCALDYLLKPIDIEELIISIQKVIKKKEESKSDVRLQYLISNMQDYKQKTNRIALPTKNEIEFVEVGEIIHCEAGGNYTTIYLDNEMKRLVVTSKIKQFEELLEGYNFIRIHNSHLINVDFVQKYIKGEGGDIVMKDNYIIPVSRRKKKELLEMLNLA